MWCRYKEIQSRKVDHMLTIKTIKEKHKHKHSSEVTTFTENQEASTVFDPKKKQKFDDTIFIDCTDIIIAI